MNMYLRHAMLLLLACGCAASAQTNWQGMGPFGGDQFMVKISPQDRNTLFTLSHHALHRSRNAGETWQALHTIDMVNGTYLDLAFKPGALSQIYVATSLGGIWYSPNEGDTWQLRSSGLPIASQQAGTYFTVASVTFAPDGRLFAGLAESSFAGLPTALIYTSTDGGLSWTPHASGISAPLPNRTQLATALVTTDAAGRIWAMVHGSGVYRYNNGTWISANGDLPASGYRGTFLAHDPSNAARALLCTEYGWVFGTTNDGQNWSRLALPTELTGLSTLPLAYTAAIDPNNGNVFWVDVNDAQGALEQPLFRPNPDQLGGAGSYVSVDGGLTWNPRPSFVFRMAIDPTETINNVIPGIGQVFRSKNWYYTAAGLGSFRKSTDGAVEFLIKSDGIRGVLVNTLYSHPSPPPGFGSILFAGAESGLYMTTNEVDNWKRQQAADQTIYSWSFARDPANPNAILYATGHPAWNGPQNRGVYRSNLSCFDGGCTPSQNQILSGVGVWKVLTSPSKPNRIIAACQEAGVQMSENNGTTWTSLTAGMSLPRSVTDILLAGNGDLRMAAFRQSSGNVTANPPQPWQYNPGESGGVYRWDTGLRQWVQMSGLNQAVTDIESAGGSPEKLYAATVDGLYRSTNGTSWQWLSFAETIFDVAVHPLNPDFLYVATGSGVYLSRNGGGQWENISSGLTYPVVYALEISFVDGAIYAATGGNGVWKRGLDNTGGAITISVTPDAGSWSVVSSPPGFGGPSAGVGDLASTSVPTGSYTVSYGALAGYDAPSAQTLNVTQGQTTAFSGAYVRQMGTFSLDVDPPTAAWVLLTYPSDYSGPKNGTGDLAPTAAPVGSYSVDFNPLAGLARPPAQSFSVAKNQLTPLSAVYGALQPERDFDDDGVDDAAVYNPSTSVWTIRSSEAQTPSQSTIGQAGGIPVTGDFDGDGITDAGTYLPATGVWTIQLSSTQTPLVQRWGWSAALPVPANYTGDSRTDIAVYHPASGHWYIRESGSGSLKSRQCGWSEVIPVVADYDGDGVADVAVWHPPTGNWFINESSSGSFLSLTFGGPGNVPAPADYDGDDHTDLAVYAPSTGTWFIRQSTTLTVRQAAWGWSTAYPLPDDYDGDGRDDVAIFDSGTAYWHIQRSSNGTTLNLAPLSTGATPAVNQYQVNRWFGLAP